jgi:hypothetical protein
MRATILVWSAVSGLLLGLFAGAALLGILAVGAALLPAGLTRFAERVRTPAVVVCLVVVPMVGAAIGYLEGRLKLR